MADHCWDPVLDSGGTIPIFIPVDPKAQPFRAIQVTREDQLVLHFKCCNCGLRASRRFKVEAEEGHGPHHASYALPEATPLPDGPCPKAK